jgi:photosystem II stability/assembly factor-like uncharacterized protein
MSLSRLLATVVKVQDGLANERPFGGKHPYSAGNHIALESQGIYVVMGHLESGTIRVRPGDAVDAGQHLAQVGNSGLTEFPHVHIQASKATGDSVWSGQGVYPDSPMDPIRIEWRGRGSMRRFYIFSAIPCFCLVFATSFAVPMPKTSPASGRSVGWIVQTSGTTANLRGVSAVDERTAWASGTNGSVLRTLDGGATWEVLAVPGAESCDFRDIEAFSTDEAVVMGIGRPARIFRTIDGGKSWEETWHSDAEGIFLDGFAFSDGRFGLAVGDPMEGRFFLLATEDGGETWAPLPIESRPLALGGEAAFAASGTSLAVHGKDRIWIGTGGPVSRIWRSEDRGKHWDVVSSTLLEGSPSAGGFSVAFLDEFRGVAVGGDYRAEAASAGNAAVSADGGKTWRPIKERNPGGFREAVAFIPGSTPSTAVTVGPSGSDYSIDAGSTWIPIEGPSGFHALGLARTTPATGWAVGRNGLIAKLSRSSLSRAGD